MSGVRFTSTEVSLNHLAAMLPVESMTVMAVETGPAAPSAPAGAIGPKLNNAAATTKGLMTCL